MYYFFQVYAQQYHKQQEKIDVFLRPCILGTHDPQRKEICIDRHNTRSSTTLLSKRRPMLFIRTLTLVSYRR